MPRVPLESPGSSEMNEEEESPDADYDLDDYDSEEEKRKKKRRPPPKSNRSSGVATTRPTRSSEASNDRPYLCTSEYDQCLKALCIPLKSFESTSLVLVLLPNPLVYPIANY